MKLTVHAISRFQSRIAPTLSFTEAESALRDAISRATRLKEKTLAGQFLWSVGSPAMRLVTKKELGEDIVVTVLAPHVDIQTAHLAQVEELLRDRQEGLARLQQMIAEVDATPKQNDASYAEKRSLLVLELQILSLEQAPLRQREKTLRHEKSEQSKREEARRLLRIALRGLVGSISARDALEKINELSPGIVVPEFYEDSAPVAS